MPHRTGHCQHFAELVANLNTVSDSAVNGDRTERFCDQKFDV
jgi:hypothetical protein